MTACRRLLPALASALLAVAAGFEGRSGGRVAEVRADGTAETKALELGPDSTTSLERPSRSGTLLRREAGTAQPSPALLNLKDPEQVGPDSTEPDLRAPDPLSPDSAGIDPVEKDFAELDDGNTGLPNPNRAARHRSADKADKVLHKRAPGRLRMLFRRAGRGGRHRKQRHRSPLQKSHGDWWLSSTEASNSAANNNVPSNNVASKSVASNTVTNNKAASKRGSSDAGPFGSASSELGASFMEQVHAENGPGELYPPPAATPLPPVVTAIPAPAQAASTTVPWEGQLDKEVEEVAAAQRREQAAKRVQDDHQKLRKWAKDIMAKAKAKAKGPLPSLTTQQSAGKELFDCDEAFNEWKFGWSVAKREWCCRYKRRACNPHEATPPPHLVHAAAVAAGPGGPGPDGETVCEGQGWSQHACISLGCCVYDTASSICYSAVADQPCSMIQKVPQHIRDQLQQRLHEGPHRDDEGRLDEVLRHKKEMHESLKPKHEDAIEAALERRLDEHDQKQTIERRYMEAQQEGVNHHLEEEIHRVSDLHHAAAPGGQGPAYGRAAAPSSTAAAPGQPGVIVVHSPTEEPTPPAPPPAAQPIIVVPPEAEPAEAPQPQPAPIIVVPPQHEEPVAAPTAAPAPPPIFVIPQHHPALAAPPPPPQPPIIIEPGATPGAPMQVISGPTDAPPAALVGLEPSSPAAPPADGN